LYLRYRGCTKIEKKREKMKGKYDIMKPFIEKDYEQKKAFSKKALCHFASVSTEEHLNVIYTSE